MNLISFHFFYSTFGKFAGCMAVDFIKLKSFVDMFPGKVMMWNNVLTKTYFCKTSFNELLVTASIRAMQKTSRKEHLLWTIKLFTEEPWRKRISQKGVLKNCILFFLSFPSFFFFGFSLLKIFLIFYFDQTFSFVQKPI